MSIRSWGLVGVLSIVPLAAHAEGYALSAKVGTVGIGAEATVHLTQKLNLRLGAGVFKYNYQGVLSDVDYALTLDLKGGAAALDFHPSGGPFRASFGLLLHGNRLDGEAVPSEPVTLGEHRYLP